MSEEKIDFYTLNVGHGDSHVIHFPKKQAAVVIDPGNAGLINLLLHQQLKIKHLPLILISHFDLDHMAGLNSIIKKCLDNDSHPGIKPGYIFFSDQFFDKSKLCRRVSDILDDFTHLQKEHDIKLEYCIADNSSAEVFKKELEKLGIDGRIIYPKRMQQKQSYKKNDFNLASVLLLLTFAHKKILYTGDLPYAGWEQVAPGEDLTSDVFKVPHHGGNISRTHTPGRDTAKILERVKPNFALISVGDIYNHPHPEVVGAIVTHDRNPHLFCTRMTKQCCNDKDNHMKEEILEFYQREMEEHDAQILRLGSEKGTLCAGTIRVTFTRDTVTPYTSPPVPIYYRMLKNLFSTRALLCRAQFKNP